MLKANLEYVVHYSDTVPMFATVYRPMLPWEMWPDRSTDEYGDLKLVSEFAYGAEDTKKFSEGISLVVSDYTEAGMAALRLATEFGLAKLISHY